MDYIWIIELDSFCTLILGILLYNFFKNYDRQTNQHYYMLALVTGTITSICDVNWGLIEGGFIPEPRAANFLTNAIYEISSTMMGYYWLCYVENALDSKFIKTKYLKHIAKLPVIIIIGGVIVSVYTGALFYIDTNNIYHRGDYVLIHVAMSYLYLVITSVHAFIKSFTLICSPSTSQISEPPIAAAKGDAVTILSYEILPDSIASNIKHKVITLVIDAQGRIS